MSRVSGDIASGDAIVEGRHLPRGFSIEADVVVVGSGAGGAVAATLLAEAGRKVVVLEEGPYVRPEDYKTFLPSDAVRRLFREAGMSMALGLGQTPMISIVSGRAVGGSSLLTGGVCFRIPGEVHHTWEKELGLPELSERAYEAAYEDVERRCAVSEVPASSRSPSTTKFIEGATKLGISMKPTRRNTGDKCEGNARCNFTCPAGAKQSVDVAYLPSATGHGARVIADALVTGVLRQNGRAAGVEGKLLGAPGGGAGHRFEVRAPVVIIACGTLHTPLLLAAAGVAGKSEALGRNITLHPAVRCVAKFDQRLDGWNGALQSVYSDQFHEDGIKLVGVYTTTNFLAAGLPGVGPALRQRIRDLPYCGVFGGMIHDEGGGAVRRGPGREGILSYRMAPRDLVRLKRCTAILAEIAIAAGAREVYTSIFGMEPLRDMDGVRAMERADIDARRIECMAFHPLGSARASRDARGGIVDARGECWELPGLFVVDGSVLPTSIGVNSQVPIMATATKMAWEIDARTDRLRAGRTAAVPGAAAAE